jgi:hypothetical protein
MQQIHSIDYQRAIRRVFASRVLELLNGLDRMARQHFFPTTQGRVSPVPVNTPDDHGSVFARLNQHLLDRLISKKCARRREPQ